MMVWSTTILLTNGSNNRTLVKMEEGYRIDHRKIRFVGYMDDIVLLGESEDGLPKIFNQFRKTAEKYNVVINEDKTKCLTTLK